MTIHNAHIAATLTGARQCLEKTFIASDGTRLFYRQWPARGPSGASRGAIAIFHRGHEHSGRVAHLADELALDDPFDIFALDARGHGRSGGARGHSPSMDRSVADMDQFVRLAAETCGRDMEHVSIIAQSVGAIVAARWLQQKKPEIRCAVLAAPAFRIRLYVPFARSALALLRKLRGSFHVNSYVRPEMLTHDAGRAASYKSDPLITRPISVGTLLDVSDAGRRAVAEAEVIDVPVQMLISGRDYVVERRPQTVFFDRLACAHKEWHDFPGFYHDTLGEAERAKPIGEARRFILRHQEAVR